MKLIGKPVKKAAIANKAAKTISNAILKFQNGFSNLMYAGTKDWNKSRQWIFLYLVCLFFGGLSIVAVIQPFRTNIPNRTFVPTSIKVPRTIKQEKYGFVITENEFQKVQAFKRKYPDLQKDRPGLYDSLTMIEQVYYSQKNK